MPPAVRVDARDPARAGGGGGRVRGRFPRARVAELLGKFDGVAEGGPARAILSKCAQGCMPHRSIIHCVFDGRRERREAARNGGS